MPEVPKITGEGAWLGEFAFTSAPIMDGAAALCIMSTRRHVLSVKCLPDRVDAMFIKLLKEATEL